MSEPRLYSTPQVAQHLGLTSAMVRRYQVAWETLCQQSLPRDSNTRSRLIDDAQLELFSQAQLRSQQNPNLSVEEALAQSLNNDPMPNEQSQQADERLEALEQALAAEIAQREAWQARLEQRGSETDRHAQEQQEQYQRLERELDDLRSKVGELFSHQQSLLRKQGDELSSLQQSLQSLADQSRDSLKQAQQRWQARFEALEQQQPGSALVPEAIPETASTAEPSAAQIAQLQQQLMRHEYDISRMRQLLEHLFEAQQPSSNAPRRSSYYSQEAHHYGQQRVNITTATIIEEFSNLALSAGEAQAAASAQTLQSLAKQSEKNVAMLARAYPLSPLGLLYWFWR